MTTYLFDSSSIVNLIKKGSIKPFAKGVTIGLAFYECLNAIWKEYRLLRRIDRETAWGFIEVIGEVLKVIETTSVKGLEKEIFNLAFKENLTVYDAAYIRAAIKNRLILVTDDRKLGEKAAKYVKVVTTEELTATNT